MGIYPVILCGVSGTRLWPLSRKLYPKQLLPLHSENSLLQETVTRVSGGEFEAPLVVCNADLCFIVAEQLRQVGAETCRIVLEPEGRNTAPAAAVAALITAETNTQALVLLLPSDHVIKESDEFIAATMTAAKVARQGRLVAIGIEPDRSETGYGYIRKGSAIDGYEGCFAVERFVEKPDQETANAFIDSGDYVWNSGMFLFPAQVYLEELERFDPVMMKACIK